jgi:Ca2+-binding EF-hand superfamily protein
MFKILDADGGGTLDMDEITALFAEAGIYATKEEVADIFANAMRM